MAATTIKIPVSSSWTQISEGDCTVQSPSKGAIYEAAVSLAMPEDAFITLTLEEATTFAYKTPVWLRLQEKGVVGLERFINIIK